MKLKTITMSLLAVLALASCTGETDDDTTAILEAGELTGGPFNFAVDGVADMVSGIQLNSFNGQGDAQSFVITDDSQNILGLPPTMADLENVNFDGAGTGTCYIYHITYLNGLSGLEANGNLNTLEGDFDLSNFITVNRGALNAGTLVGGPFDFTVDGKADMVSGITLDNTMLNGDLQTFVITDDTHNILGLPPTLADVEAVNFDGAGAGSCYIYHLTYSDTLGGLEAGGNLDTVTGQFAVSNFIVVNRNALNAGSLSGGPYNFTVDGTADFVTDITLDATNLNGSLQTYVVTDADLNILGLPPTLEMVAGIDFDAAGIGVCLVWHLTYENGLQGLEVGSNAANLEGYFALSNEVTVNRNPNAGTISGGPFNFMVDGTANMVSGISLDSSMASGSLSTWVITDASGTILGLPPGLAEVESIDFDAAGNGVCLIWYMRYEDGLMGLELNNDVANLQGLYGLSNSITVNRN